MAAETRFEGDPKQEQKEDADLQQVVSWLLHDNFLIALPTSGSYWLQNYLVAEKSSAMELFIFNGWMCLEGDL